MENENIISKENFLLDYTKSDEVNLENNLIGHPDENLENNTLFFITELNFNLNSVITSEYEDVYERTRKASNSIENEEDRIVSNDSGARLRERENSIEDEITMNTDESIYRKLAVVKTEKYKYVGELRNGQRDGFGICYYTRGEIYIGQWKQEQKHGMGKIVLPNGYVHIGELKENKFEGYCEILNYKKNIEISGYSSNGKLTGEIIAKIGDKIIEADFGQKVFGKITISDSKYFIGEIDYEVCAELSKIIHGISIHKQKHIYLGQMDKSSLIPNGYGEFYYDDQSKFYGFFNDGKKEGLGFYLTKDGKLSIGKYINDQRCGPFLQISKGSNLNTVKLEMYHQGFKSKTVDKYESIKKYLPLYYPEYSGILNINFKTIFDKFGDLNEDDTFLHELYKM